MRVVAILAVVFLHFPPWEFFQKDPLRCPEGCRFLLDCCRFAVPYFFIAAGYFSGRSATRKNWRPRALWSRASYLMLLYLFWSVLYILVWNDWSAKRETRSVVEILRTSLADAWSESIGNPLLAVFNGPSWHLWFLPALASGLVIVGLLHWSGRRRWILPAGLLLYAAAVLFGPYRQAFGLAPAHNRFRNGPFLSTLFVGLGWIWGSRPEWQPRRSSALLLFVVGLILQYAESSALVALNVVRYHPEYSATTPLFGAGAFLLALANPRIGFGTVAPTWGRYTLGVYVLHLFVGMTSRPLYARWPQLLALAHVPATYLASLALTGLIAKIRVLKPLVM